MFEKVEEADLVYQDVADVMEDWYGISLGRPAFEKIVLSDPWAAAELEKWGVHDTVVREHIVSLISTEMMGTAWPIYKDNWSDEKLDAFVETLNAKLLELEEAGE